MLTKLNYKINKIKNKMKKLQKKILAGNPPNNNIIQGIGMKLLFNYLDHEKLKDYIGTTKEDLLAFFKNCIEKINTHYNLTYTTENSHKGVIKIISIIENIIGILNENTFNFFSKSFIYESDEQQLLNLVNYFTNNIKSTKSKKYIKNFIEMCKCTLFSFLIGIDKIYKVSIVVNKKDTTIS